MASVWIGNTFDNLPEEGARAQRYASLAAELAGRGHDVVWWTASFSHSRKDVRRAVDGTPLPAACDRPDGSRLRLVPTPPYRSNVGLARIRSHRAFAANWRAAAEAAVASGELVPPSTVIVSSPPLSAFAAAAAFRSRWGARVVLDLMDAWPDAFAGLVPGPPFLGRLAVALFLRPLRRAADCALRGADALSAVSESYVSYARRRGAAAPAAAFRHTCDALRPPTADDRGTAPLKLVYVGNMGRLYDLATLLNALSRLNAGGVRATLDLAGSGPDEPRLRRLAAGDDAVRFHGFLGEDDFHALLARGDAGVVPLRSASCVAVPYKLTDYASHGLAIINCLEGECGALVSRYGAGLNYRVGDSAGLAAAITSLAGDPARLAACRAASLRMADECFLASRIYPAFADFVVG